MAVYIYLVAAIFALLYLVYNKICNKLTYWERLGVKGPKPQIPYGNFKRVFDKIDPVHVLCDEIYKQYPKERVVGIYQGLTPVLLIRDPDLVKRILIKDFGSFTDRGFKITNEPMSRNMFAEDGDIWRILRQKFSPLFTTGKLKNMMHLINHCVEDYMKNLDNLVAKQAEWEIRSLNMKYTLKTIASTAFGLEVETFNEEGAFVQMAQRIFKRSIWNRVAFLLHSISPGLPDKLGIKVGKPETKKFFTDLVTQVVRQREGKPKLRKDFMDLMIELREQGTMSKSSDEGTAELEMTFELMMAQAVLFYVAGFETSSGAMSFLLYELALNPSVQQRCFEEIKQVMTKYNEELTYESLNEFPYTSMAFDEGLRRHSPAGMLLRQTVNDYKFQELNLTLKKGTKVFIPVDALHMDEQYFPEPESFKPERFSPQNKHLIRDCTYLPFGDGPRNCIGLRFAKVQSMLGIVHLLYRFRVEPCEKTVMKIRPDPQQPTITSIDGLWLKIVRR